MHALHRPRPAGGRAPLPAAASRSASAPSSSRRPAALAPPRAAANPPDAPPAKSGGGGGGGSTWLASIIQKFGPTTEAPPVGAITVLDFEKPLVELDNRIREVRGMGNSGWSIVCSGVWRVVGPEKGRGQGLGARPAGPCREGLRGEGGRAAPSREIGRAHV